MYQRLRIIDVIHNDIASNVVVGGEEKAEYRVQLFKSLDLAYDIVVLT